ncbi:transcriptional regulator [Endozoicomonas montiporae]|uniref:Transcriptional regulator n=2 Tax=Endozoicomonas montiporae TaxID=1027273 RepID=A0A081N2L2_9GAMM|nr:HTH-type transcriptional activator IlvY [Endozoicomonas montiporae]AMO54811.1 DNA-binding transcriptional regulator IlvY [Endozoicomonas montiporae CL-33]KEQ12685.1 transcriptional regulator [Endozoicomonas montiporae]
MDTRLLKHFLSLADSLHFGRASAACHISPSTLSRSIQQLEESLGVLLFERDNRSVQLTREGLLFQEYARDAQQQWDGIRNQLMAAAGQLSGEISVYCSVTASYSFLYDILSQFRQSYPGIEIKLHTGDPEPAIQHVLSGQEDISIAARPDQLPTELAFHSIGLSPLIFIAPADGSVKHPFNDQDWAATPMILAEKGISRRRTNQWFANKNIKPRIYAQVAGNEAIVSMVSLGFGIGVVPQIVLDNSPLSDKVQVIDVKPWLPAYDVGLCVLEKKLKNPLIRAFWSLLNQQ